MGTYLFYDVETSGLSPAFDQILTFACILTDPYLNEIERHSITVRMRPDIIPSPHAFITHRLKPSDLRDAMCEFDAIRKIHELVNRPNTQSIGYNSLGFDDDFLRFSFYRNLLDPYAHQYANGCFRGDMLPLAALYRVFAPDVLDWPELEGKPTLKLEYICQANDFETSGKAHEAMADVEALVAMTRAFAGKPEMWRYGMSFYDKKEDLKRLATLGTSWSLSNQISYPMGIMVSPSFGAKSGYISPVIRIGNSIPYKNQSLWLRLDHPDIVNIDEESRLYQWFVIRKRPADQWLVLPCLDRFWQRISDEAKEIVAENLSQFTQAPERFLKTVRHHESFAYPEVPNIDPDSALYQDGFFSFGEKREIASFFATKSIGEKIAAVGKMESRRVKVLASRILERNYPEAGDMGFSASEYQEHLKKVNFATGDVVGYKGDTKYTAEQCRRHMDEILGDEGALDEEQKAVLEDLQAYLAELI